MSIIVALIVFSCIILFHELGHFLLAKANGVTVLEFSLGMGPKLISREWRGTEYSLKLLPFGGSCMMLGEDEEDLGRGSFGSISVLGRISVIAAGPFFNFIMAFAASLIITSSLGYDPSVLEKVLDGFSAQEAGIQAGDEITHLNGKRIFLAREILYYVDCSDGKPVDITYRHEGEEHTVTLEPRQDENGQYLLGIVPDTSYVKGNIFQTIKYSAVEVKYWIDITVQSLKLMIKGKVSVNDMAGPVGVVSIIGETYTESVKVSYFAAWINILNIAILLSANLGVMNLLPLPALDGGRLVFLLIELIRGKRIDPEKEGMVHLAGLILLMGLMVFVMFNDIMRLL